jgi:hypothetical protein
MSSWREAGEERFLYDGKWGEAETKDEEAIGLGRRSAH